MKRTLLALTLGGLLSSTGALASNVEVYGVLDYGLTWQQNDAVDGTSESSLKMLSSQYIGSRVGIKGSEDLGNGLKVGFVLENGFDADTGSLGDHGTRHVIGSRTEASCDYHDIIAAHEGLEYLLDAAIIRDDDDLGHMDAHTRELLGKQGSMAVLDYPARELRADYDKAGLHLFLAFSMIFSTAPATRSSADAYEATRAKRFGCWTKNVSGLLSWVNTGT